MIGVIGDVHGCYHTLKALVDQVREKYGAIDLYCVGDLVDRGMHSSLVIEYCMASNIRVTLGNHDCMFLYSFKYPNHPYRASWILNGNTETLTSYASFQEDFKNHFSYLEQLPLFYNLADCFISHAGVSVLYEMQLRDSHGWNERQWSKFLTNEMEKDIGILWNRSLLYNMGKLQIVGHTRQVEVTKNERTNSLYIDTAASAGNRLSCVIIEEGNWVDTFSLKTDQQDLVMIWQ